MPRKPNPAFKNPSRMAPKDVRLLPEEQGKSAVIRCREDLRSNLCSIEHSNWNINDYRVLLREIILSERPDLFERLNALIDQNLFDDNALKDLLYIQCSPGYFEIVLYSVESMVNCESFQEIMELGVQIKDVIIKNFQETHESKQLNSRVLGIFTSVFKLLAEKLSGKRFMNN